MSYTRSGRSVGRGTQLTYHQPPRPLGQQFVPQSQQAYLHQQSQPQQQHKPQQEHQTPQQQQQYKMTQPTQQTQVPPTPQTPQPVAPPKVEPVTPKMETKMEVPSPVVGQAPTGQAQEAAQTGDAAESTPRPWKKQKNATFKVNKVQKRRRQNARFRKLLIPKNAIMVLNELQPGIVFEAEEQTNAFNQATYLVKLEIDGEVYRGEGPSKGAAKAAAAEAAVKGLILKKIAESNIKKDAPETEEQLMDTGSGDDASDKGSVNGRRVIPEDEVPWGSLASFALFKLFADWKAQGSCIPPVVAPSLSAPKPSPKPMQAPKAQGPPAAKPAMPDNPESLHPVTLVGRLHPGNLFTELCREGNPPSMTFTMGVTINGVQYTGVARSKKEAKKLCAINALKGLGVPYNTTL